MKLYGIVGHPVAKSLSPAMHNAAIEHLGLDARYDFIDISPEDSEELANFCYETDLNNIGGFSVTMPYKKEVMAYMDHYDPAAKIIGSVNTVLNEESKLIGYNTDAAGFIQALREKVEPMGKKALVMGAGGAARAIIYSLKELGSDVYVYNRSKDKAEELEEELNIQIIEREHIQQAAFDIIINATPVGSAPNTNASLLDADHIKAGAVVMDIITNPIKTQLLKEAERANAETISGERMLLFQAAQQFEIWFQKEAPVKIMEEALYKALNNRS